MSGLRLATRSSALALAQARLVAQALGDAEIVEITTAGDRGAGGGDKSRWVTELEQALLDGTADLAVHSAKDVPGELAEGLEIAAVPRRADARDALVGVPSLEDLPVGARVGTSSLRRAAQLRAAREDVEVVPLRGNVDTRLRKLADGEWDAIVLAFAGLHRLGRAGEATCVLDVEDFVPAAGQGALALEARAGDERVAAALAPLDHGPSHDRLLAERALTRELGATCNTPVGAHATEDGALMAFAGLPDGSAWVRDRLHQGSDPVRAHQGSDPVRALDDPSSLGRAVAERMLAAGARALLDGLREPPA